VWILSWCGTPKPDANNVTCVRNVAKVEDQGFPVQYSYLTKLRPCSKSRIRVTAHTSNFFLVDIHSLSDLRSSHNQRAGFSPGGDGFLSSVSDPDRCFPLMC
jgi:hypothetical protein